MADNVQAGSVNKNPRLASHRRWAITSAVVLGIAVLAAMVWYHQKQRQLVEQSENDVEAAVSKSHEQSARALAVTAASIFNKAPPLALLLATESLNISKRTDTERILRSMLAQPTGIPLQSSGPSLAITSIEISGDGRWIFAGGAEGSVRVWDREHPNAEPQVLSGPNSGIIAVAASRDGRWVVSGATDNMVRVWDRKNTKPALSASWPLQGVTSLGISPEGRWVVAGGADGKLRVWDRENPDAESQTLEGGEEHPPAITRVALSADARWVISGGQDGMVRVWDRQGSEAVPQTWRTLKGSVTGLAVSGDARWVAAGGDNGIVRVWDRSVPEPEELASWGYEGAITSVAMSSDGGWVVTGEDDGTVRVKRPGGGDWPQLWRAHQGAVTDVAVSSDGRWVVSGGQDGTLRLWDQELLGVRARRAASRPALDYIRCFERRHTLAGCGRRRRCGARLGPGAPGR